MFCPKVQFNSVAQSCLSLCDPTDCSTPGLPVHHQLPEFAQTHVCWVGDAIQSSRPLSSPSPPALNLSHHQHLFPVSWLFASGSQSIGVSASASVLLMSIQDWFPLGLTGLIFLQSGDSQESSSAPQFKSINSLVLSLLYGPTLTPYMTTGKNHSFDYIGLYLTILGIKINPCFWYFSSAILHEVWHSGFCFFFFWVGARRKMHRCHKCIFFWSLKRRFQADFVRKWYSLLNCKLGASALGLLSKLYS